MKHKCLVIIPVGPGHEEIVKEAEASVESAKHFSKGPFKDIFVHKIDDTQGALGRSKARNLAVRKAKNLNCDWIYFLDADDLLFKEAFQIFSDYADQFDAVWGAIAELAPGENVATLRPQQVLNVTTFNQLISCNPYLALQMGHFVKTEIASATPFKEAMNSGEDYDYYYRVWKKHNCIKIDLPFFINRRGMHSTGPKSANGTDWNETVNHLLSMHQRSTPPIQKQPTRKPSTICHIFRADPTQVGDWFGLPAHYLPFPSKDHILDINAVDEQTPLGDTLIVGGGDLLGPAFPQMEQLLARTGLFKIGWGLGKAVATYSETGFVEDKSLDFPDYLRAFDLIGVRAFGTEYEWLPCASCLHPAFSKAIDIRNEVAVFEDKRFPLNIPGLPVMKDEGGQLEVVLEFIGSSEVLLTNSYYGAYWAILLGRRVVAFPVSTEFYGFKHPIPLCRPNEWKAHVDQTETHPSALNECRIANVRFFQKAFESISNG